MQVSRGAYYEYLGRSGSAGSERQAEFDRQVRECFGAGRRLYGARRIGAELLARFGVSAGRQRIRSSMRRQQLVSVHEKAFRPATTDSRATQRIAGNLLGDGANRPVGPGMVLTGDITYIRLAGGKFCYLAVFIDLLTKEVAGWQTGPDMRAELVTGALSRALVAGRIRRGAIIHTDRGSQYGSDAFLALLEQNGLRPSMSRKGNCWDNAWSESFFATLKKELTEGGAFAGVHEARIEIDWYIRSFYNTRRRHSSIGNLSPQSYAATWYRANPETRLSPAAGSNPNVIGTNLIMEASHPCNVSGIT